MSTTLQRFHLAQGHGADSAYEQALAELRSGRKQGHWIWFVLPQLRGGGWAARRRASTTASKTWRKPRPIWRILCCGSVWRR